MLSPVRTDGGIFGDPAVAAGGLTLICFAIAIVVAFLGKPTTGAPVGTSVRLVVISCVRIACGLGSKTRVAGFVGVDSFICQKI